jgi:hypothetical protein
MTTPVRRWRNAWIGLALALALHVTDEALSGFLVLYNSIAGEIRAAYPWLPIPVFSFPIWLGGLVAGIVLLLVLTPLVARGSRWLRTVSLVLGVLMIGNAAGHIGMSVYQSRLAPGVLSSPVLLVAAIALVVTAARARLVRAAPAR